MRQKAWAANQLKSFWLLAYRNQRRGDLQMRAAYCEEVALSGTTSLTLPQTLEKQITPAPARRCTNALCEGIAGRPKQSAAPAGCKPRHQALSCASMKLIILTISLAAGKGPVGQLGHTAPEPARTSLPTQVARDYSEAQFPQALTHDFSTSRRAPHPDTFHAPDAICTKARIALQCKPALRPAAA